LFGFSFSQYRLQAINSIRGLNSIAIFFILRLDLIIGLIHIIAQQIQKIRALDPFFKFLGNQGELERTETTKIFVDAGVNSNSPSSPLICDEIDFHVLTQIQSF